MIKMMIKMKNPPGLYVIHMLESDGVKRRALRARRLERPPISNWPRQEQKIIRIYAKYLYFK